MIEDDGNVPATMRDIAELKDLALGNIDAMVAIAITLANAGVISREDLVRQFDVALDQQQQRDGDRHPGTRYALVFIRNMFAAPVFVGRPN